MLALLALGFARSGNCRRHRRRGRGAFARRAARQPRGIRCAHRRRAPACRTRPLRAQHRRAESRQRNSRIAPLAGKDPRVQDPYSLRCAPQVHGAVRDALAQVRATLTIELNSATDNPLVFAETSSGEVRRSDQRRQFSRPAARHGRRPAGRRAGDARRNLRAPHRANDQPADQPAARVSGARSGTELRIHDSAGHRRRARERNRRRSPRRTRSIRFPRPRIRKITSRWAWAPRGGSNQCSRTCEIFSRSNLLAACQGIDLLAPLRPGPETRKAYDIVRALSPAGDADRSLAPDIEAVAARSPTAPSPRFCVSRPLAHR